MSDMTPGKRLFTPDGRIFDSFEAKRVADFDASVEQEKARQVALGYTAEHDAEHGPEHLLLWSFHYARQGKSVKSAALIQAALAVVAQLESALASERAKRAEAEKSAVFAGKEWADWQQRAVAAEATIEQAMEAAAQLGKLPIIEAGSGKPAWFKATYEDWTPRFKAVQNVLANADTSALARHDAEVLRAAAQALRKRTGQVLTATWLDERAAEREAER